jgi:hypothetical protein
MQTGAQAKLPVAPLFRRPQGEVRANGGRADNYILNSKIVPKNPALLLLASSSTRMVEQPG